MSLRIGFMQGRLSALENGLIQSFPWKNWQVEIVEASLNNYKFIEWTLDNERLYENPIMHESGRQLIKKLINKHSVSINSLTADCFMQKPFWKEDGESIKVFQKDFLNVVKSCASIKVKLLVVPLVDNGSIKNVNEENVLLNFLKENYNFFKINKMKIIFESDFPPLQLKKFINKLPADVFGINYDTGNSANLGYNSKDEFKAYGSRIWNVHIKDRLFGGPTVPLTEGNVNFEEVFSALKMINYKGNFILQTARSKDDDHLLLLNRFRTIISEYIISYSL